MGVEEEIFEEFFKKLASDNEFPKTLLIELKNLYADGWIASKDSIIDAIFKEGINED